jgi:hypothetical protein
VFIQETHSWAIPGSWHFLIDVFAAERGLKTGNLAYFSHFLAHRLFGG